MITPTRLAKNQKLKGIIPTLIWNNATIDILDVGCGSGTYAKFFADLGIDGKYLGIDINKSSVWKNGKSGKLNIEFKQHDAEICHKIGRKFDIVFSSQALEHVKNDRRAIDSMMKCVKIGGYLVVTVPSKSAVLLYGVDHGYRYYDEEELRSFVDGTNFEIVDIQKIGGVCTFIAQVFAWRLPRGILGVDVKNIPKFNEFISSISKLAIEADESDERLKTFECGLVMVARKETD